MVQYIGISLKLLSDLIILTFYKINITRYAPVPADLANRMHTVVVKIVAENALWQNYFKDFLH
jgi:hypothetical protein